MTQMGQTSQFGGPFQPVMDYAKKGHATRFFYKPGKQWRMEEFKDEYVVKNLSFIKYLFINNLEFPRKE
jgi:hypothetical protein